MGKEDSSCDLLLMVCLEDNLFFKPVLSNTLESPEKLVLIIWGPKFQSLGMVGRCPQTNKEFKRIYIPHVLVLIYAENNYKYALRINIKNPAEDISRNLCLQLSETKREQN